MSARPRTPVLISPLKRGEFPEEQILKEQGYAHGPTARTGPLTLKTFIRHTVGGSDDLSHWTIVNHKNRPIAAIHHAPNGSEIRMVHPDAKAEFTVDVGRKLDHLKPGQRHETEWWAYSPKSRKSGKPGPEHLMRHDVRVIVPTDLPENKLFQKASLADIEKHGHGFRFFIAPSKGEGWQSPIWPNRIKLLETK